MTENYLHFLWRNKRITIPNLKLHDGRQLSILNFGSHNNLLKGPDFNLGAIQLDGLEFHGPIELHVKSSDWYAHKHDTDSNYDNVILHVVYEHDREVIQNGRTLPVLELKEHIDTEHWRKHKTFTDNSNRIICERDLSKIPEIYLSAMKESAIVSKLTERVQLVESYMRKDDDPFYFFLSAAFGSNTNKLAFLDLARKVPKQQLVNLSGTQRYNLLASESGLIAKDTAKSNWHFKGNRPSNFPTLRLKQFAYILSEIDFMNDISPEQVQGILKRLYGVFEYFNTKYESVRLSNSFKNTLVINGVVPYLWFLSIQLEDEKYQDLALDILQSIPSEINRVIKKWGKTGVKIESACDSQGLLALYKFYCCRKKCLSCAVGNKLLNN